MGIGEGREGRVRAGSRLQSGDLLRPERGLSMKGIEPAVQHEGRQDCHVQGRGRGRHPEGDAEDLVEAFQKADAVDDPDNERRDGRENGASDEEGDRADAEAHRSRRERAGERSRVKHGEREARTARATSGMTNPLRKPMRSPSKMNATIAMSTTVRVYGASETALGAGEDSLPR